LPASVPMVDRCAAVRCAMDPHAAGLHRCRWSTAALHCGARWIVMRPARIRADGRPLRCGAVRDGSSCGRPASVPMVDRCAALRCAMDRHAAGPHRCRWSTVALRCGARWIGGGDHHHGSLFTDRSCFDDCALQPWLSLNIEILPLMQTWSSHSIFAPFITDVHSIK